MNKQIEILVGCLLLGLSVCTGCMSRQYVSNGLDTTQTIIPSTSTVQFSDGIVIGSTITLTSPDGVFTEARIVMQFDFDSTVLKDDVMVGLITYADRLRGKKRITITGYCDERGTDAYNIALGQRRAKAVQAYLKFLGITDTITESYGELDPVNPDHNEQAWATNRRVEITWIEVQ